MFHRFREKPDFCFLQIYRVQRGMLAQMAHLDKGYHDNLIHFYLSDCFDHKVVNN